MESTVYVIKISGNIIDDEARLNDFLHQFAGLTGPKILVHGGGKLATELAIKMGIEQQMVDGRRITDAETLKVVTMVYAGLINKSIVARLQAIKCAAIGMTGADADIIRAHKRTGVSIDYGFVGDIDAVDADVLYSLLQQNLAVVIAPVTHDGAGQLLNTNADTVAQEVAKALSNYGNVSLVYSFEKNGVLLDAADESTVIPTLNADAYRQLKKEGKVYAGMIPKLENAFAALDSGVSRVIIGKAEELSVLVEGRSGTTITHA